jgi:Rad3-related DNA helicase
MIKINDNLNIYFPLELKPREQQIEALEFTKKSINNGKKNILLNLPTGAGKSYFIIMFANWYKNFINNNAKFDIITNSKILQSQYVNDFPFIKSLKGTSNYYCDFHKTNCSEGKELNKVLKRVCNNCPYDHAKRMWIDSDIGSSNFALFISLALYTENLEQKNSNVLIIDEAHDFESVFCDFISTKLSKNVLKKCGLSQILQTNYLREFKKIKKHEDFIKFIENDFLNNIQNHHEKLTENIRKESEKNIKNIKTKQLSYCLSLIEKLDKLIENYYKYKDNWSLDISYDKENNIELILQPIWGYPFLNDIIWKNYDHIIFMSGTLLDKKMYSYINGLDENITTYKEMNSVFDIKKRPLYYIKVGKMTYKEKEKTFENQIEVINKILKKYKDKKGIIHTVNYELNNWLKEKIICDRFIFHDPDNREEKYQEFLESNEPKIMISPSMMSGIDLHSDRARFAIMLKIPYPNISSNKIKARQKSNKDWYNFKTCSDIIQTYGRTIRSESDYSDTFLLDESFSNILKYNSKYLPRYFTNAIKILK